MVTYWTTGLLATECLSFKLSSLHLFDLLKLHPLPEGLDDLEGGEWLTTLKR